VPATSDEFVVEAETGLRARDVKDAFDVARHVVEKRLTKVLGRDVKEGDSYYVRDDVSAPLIG
jgi:hypothetical protein